MELDVYMQAHSPCHSQPAQFQIYQYQCSTCLHFPHTCTVPDPPRNVSTLKYGTQNINVKWAPPDTRFDNIANTLRGPVENLLYYVRVGEREIATSENEVNLTSVDGLLPGTLYTIEV